MKRLFYLLVLLCSIIGSISAENKWDHINRRNEIRIGWGDQLFETLMWHNPTHVVNTMPASWQQTYREDFRYSQHIWIEYQWRFNYWFSLGGMMDHSAVSWNNVTRDGTGLETNRAEHRNFFNIVIMPTVRFTYFHHDYVNLYSGIGLGMDINGGTEKNSEGKNTDLGLAINFTVIGLSANYDRWFWTVDFGGLYALKNANTIFLASSRIINVGLGVRF